MEQGSLSLLCAGQEPADDEEHTFRGTEHIARTMDQGAVVGGLSRGTHGATDRYRWPSHWRI